MRAIRRANTKPEILLRKLLHAKGLRFRKDYRVTLPSSRVRPDVVFTRRRVAVFVDSCFWHVCPKHGHTSSVNSWYWGLKLTRNIQRDRAADAALISAGWMVIRIWEHEDLMHAARRIASVLSARGEGPAS
jgi:DNA mismatch endonuclease, patch repair protein